jgi:hypothetical protein
MAYSSASTQIRPPDEKPIAGLGEDLQHIVQASVGDLRTEQPKIVVLWQDPILLVFSGLAGLGLGLNHLPNDSITDEARTGLRDNLERFGAGACANHVDRCFGALIETLVLKSVVPHSGEGRRK